MRLRRILEYLNREDAERAVKELSGRDLRGQAVRVDLHDDVSIFSVPGGGTFNAFASATLTITAVMNAATIERIATGMIVSGTIVIEMSATATIATTVTVKKGLPSDVIGRVLLPVVAKMIVAPGHLP
jgi:hypothetical protein